jgi:hypothetical protein
MKIFSFFFFLKKKSKESQTYLSKASRYFCFRISKKIFIECRLSSSLVNPERYFSTSSQFPLSTSSSKYLRLKKNPDSCSSLLKNKNRKNGRTKKFTRTELQQIGSWKQGYWMRNYLWRVSLNLSSSRNCKIRKMRSLLREVAIGNFPFLSPKPASEPLSQQK